MYEALIICENSCYAGDLGNTRASDPRPNRSGRCFEFLGACPSGNVTRSPGPESFTTALIWALKSLVKDQTRFTVSDLSRKVKEYSNFPATQMPVQLDRGVHAIERIMLAPLAETKDIGETKPITTEEQGLLTLNFIFDSPPPKDTVERFADLLSRSVSHAKMPVNRIGWGGLQQWPGVAPSPKAHSAGLKAVKVFQNLARRKSPKTHNGAEATHASSALIHTPETETPSASPGREEKDLPEAKKRKA